MKEFKLGARFRKTSHYINPDLTNYWPMYAALEYIFSGLSSMRRRAACPGRAAHSPEGVACSREQHARGAACSGGAACLGISKLRGNSKIGIYIAPLHDIEDNLFLVANLKATLHIFKILKNEDVLSYC